MDYYFRSPGRWVSRTECYRIEKKTRRQWASYWHRNIKMPSWCEIKWESYFARCALYIYSILFTTNFSVLFLTHSLLLLRMFSFNFFFYLLKFSLFHTEIFVHTIEEVYIVPGFIYFVFLQECTFASIKCYFNFIALFMTFDWKLQTLFHFNQIVTSMRSIRCLAWFPSHCCSNANLTAKLQMLQIFRMFFIVHFFLMAQNKQFPIIWLNM